MPFRPRPTVTKARLPIMPMANTTLEIEGLTLSARDRSRVLPNSTPII